MPPAAVETLLVDAEYKHDAHYIPFPQAYSSYDVTYSIPLHFFYVIPSSLAVYIGSVYNVVRTVLFSPLFFPSQYDACARSVLSERRLVFPP